MTKINKFFIILLILMTTGCSEFSLLMSGSSIAISQNAYVKAYNGVDVLTIMNTEHDIKTHTLNKTKEIVKEWHNTKDQKQH